MTDKEKYPSELAERFQIRLPAGLRDRIKAYAERHGRSMNTEIVRILEREYPEQWHVDTRLDQLAQLVEVLKSGAADPRLDEFIGKFEETVQGIVSGRVIGVDAETRNAIANMWQGIKERESEAIYEAAQSSQLEYEEDELEAFELTGRYEKYAVPPPKRPDPIHDGFRLMDIIPRGPLSEMVERLGKGDTEGAAEIVRKIPKEEIEKRLKFHALTYFEQEAIRQDPNQEAPEDGYAPFKLSE